MVLVGPEAIIPKILCIILFAYSPVPLLFILTRLTIIPIQVPIILNNYI